MNEVEILLFLSLKILDTTPASGQFPHWQNDFFFPQKNNSFLKFEIIIFSMIYYEVVIQGSEII